MTIETMIERVRILTGDTKDSKAANDQLGRDTSYPVDGSNVTFKLQNVPLVPGSLALTIRGTGAVVRQKAGISITDEAHGIFDLVAAPNPGTGQDDGAWVDYNWFWMADDKYREFITQAAENLQGAAAPNPASVISGLVPAMMQYALALAWRARASLYAEKYSSSGGEAGQSVQSVAEQYRKMAQDADKRGDTLRDDFYKKQGARNSVASNGPGAPSFDPISPMR